MPDAAAAVGVVVTAGALAGEGLVVAVSSAVAEGSLASPEHAARSRAQRTPAALGRQNFILRAYQRPL
jgi:hypothetical protein